MDPQPSSTRQAIDLGGTWECCPAEIETASPPADAAWCEMVVPSNWHLAGLPNHAGTVFFRRRFRYPARTLTRSRGERRSHRTILRFHGVDYFAEVWLNGVRLGEHEGYFAPFEFEVGGLLRDDNELLVRVAAPKEAAGDWPNRKRLIKGIFQHHDCRPGAWDPEHGQDEGTGGIWNRVELELVAPTYLASLRVEARPPVRSGGAAPLLLLVETDSLEARSARLRVRARGLALESESITLLEATLSLPSGRLEHRYQLELPRPRLWWPWDQGEPHLYELRAELEPVAGFPDALTVEFGVRELRIADDTTWWLNGRRIFPRGTNIIPTQWLATYDHAAIERDVALLKQANVNAVRVHAHVNREELYRACDRAGLLVWQDFALQWSYQESEELVAAATRQIAEMGRQLFNHPSIVVWCCHNEPSVNRDTLDPLLAEALREADTSRHIEEASDFRTHPYPGWYWSGVDEFRARPSGPFISEFGAQALPDREALEAMLAPGDLWPPNWRAWAYRDFQYDTTINVAGLLPDGDPSVASWQALDDWIRRSQTYQAHLLQVAIESYRRGKYRPISGLFQFMFVECWDAITWAVLDYQRRPKAGYHALRRAFQPLLPSIDLRREHAMAGGEIQVGLWLVNDLPRAFDDLSLRFGLRDLRGRVWWSEERAVSHLDADGLLPVFTIEASGFSPWRAPDDAPPGRYVVFAELFDRAGVPLAANEAPFEIRPRPPGL
jgi:beta-mannosidase